MTNNLKILTSFWFVAALSILLLNDFVLKTQYHNWFTGKLSDFAGLFIFPLFFAALLPKHKISIFLLTALFFVFWKSEFSQFFIAAWNSLGLLSVSRIIDVTDNLALIVLPVAFIYETRKEKFFTFKLHPVFPLSVALFAFTATSYRTEIIVNKTYTLDFTKETIVKRVNKIDSTNLFKLNFTKNNPDTITFNLYSHTCFRDITMIVTELKENKTLITLVSSKYQCPGGSQPEKQEELIKDFEKKIVHRIKNER